MQQCSTSLPIQHCLPGLLEPNMKMMLTKLKFLGTKRYVLFIVLVHWSYSSCLISDFENSFSLQLFCRCSVNVLLPYVEQTFENTHCIPSRNLLNYTYIFYVSILFLSLTTVIVNLVSFYLFSS